MVRQRCWPCERVSAIERRYGVAKTPEGNNRGRPASALSNRLIRRRLEPPGRHHPCCRRRNKLPLPPCGQAGSYAIEGEVFRSGNGVIINTLDGPVGVRYPARKRRASPPGFDRGEPVGPGKNRARPDVAAPFTVFTQNAARCEGIACAPLLHHNLRGFRHPEVRGRTT